jgi:hypothetical protein
MVMYVDTIKRLIAFFVIVIMSFSNTGCTKIVLEADTTEYETVKLVVDDKVINSGDDFRVIEPLWWSVSIYDGEERYNSDLAQFSEPQRYVFAIEWYMSEVNNGGHDQFYFNSTGIVWEDAMLGFQAIGAQENYRIIKESADKLSGNPSKDREKRQDELDTYTPDFEDLDIRYYESEKSLLKKLNDYIKANADAFYFSGEVKIPKL